VTSFEKGRLKNSLFPITRRIVYYLPRGKMSLPTLFGRFLTGRTKVINRLLNSRNLWNDSAETCEEKNFQCANFGRMTPECVFLSGRFVVLGFQFFPRLDKSVEEFRSPCRPICASVNVKILECMWILMIVFVCSDDPTGMRLLGDCAIMFCFIVDSPPTCTL